MTSTSRSVRAHYNLGQRYRGLEIDASIAVPLYEAGLSVSSVCSEALPTLHAYAKAVGFALGVTGDAFFTGILSPAGTGFGLHFDVQSNFILQIEGTKHWSYGAAPGTAYPLASLTADPAHVASYRADA
jgi:ribosomal protein L16 Arg81 hydroxylase